MSDIVSEQKTNEQSQLLKSVQTLYDEAEL